MYFLMIADRIFDSLHFHRLHWTSHNRMAIKGVWKQDSLGATRNEITSSVLYLVEWLDPEYAFSHLAYIKARW